MKKDNVNRRDFLKVAGVAGSSLIPLKTIGSSSAHAQDFPLIEESNPSAVALGYYHDAADVDLSKFPQRGTPEGAEQFCDNCALYTGIAGAETGPCAIFPAKSVMAKGWCSVWAPKPV